jgi:predicted enzyme related to lactoylglutathione lyase
MPGKIVHFELPAKDADRSAGFWSGVFGWEFADSGTPGMDYRMVHISDDQGGAVFASEDAGSGVIVYFDTDDIQGSIAKVRELGGKAEEKMPVPGHGWFAPCKDTEGNAFRLWQADESASMPA